MKKIWKYGLLMAGVLAAAVAANQLARDPGEGIFYRVTGGKNEMYLLGSIHVGSREMYPMSQSIRSALKNADVLVFECDTASPGAAAATAELMKSEKALSSLVSGECYEQLEKAAQRLGYEMSAFEAMKPWAVTSTLTVAAAAQQMDAGSSRTASALGVENMVRRQADGKTIEYLETVQEQLQLMERFSPALQEYLLSSACQAVLHPDKISGTDRDIDQWPLWWKEGNAQAFADSYIHGLREETSPELAEEYHQALMTTRNQQMAQKLKVMLESDGPHSYLVTVGLMHLVLPQDSIIAQLQSMGYCVEQIVSSVFAPSQGVDILCQ